MVGVGSWAGEGNSDVEDCFSESRSCVERKWFWCSWKEWFYLCMCQVGELDYSGVTAEIIWLQKSCAWYITQVVQEWKWKVLVSQLRLTLCHPMDSSPPGFSVHGILQQEYWSCSQPLLQGIFLTQGLNPGLLHCRWNLSWLSHQGSPGLYMGLVFLSTVLRYDFLVYLDLNKLLTVIYLLLCIQVVLVFFFFFLSLLW